MALHLWGKDKKYPRSGYKGVSIFSVQGCFNSVTAVSFAHKIKFANGPFKFAAQSTIAYGTTEANIEASAGILEF